MVDRAFHVVLLVVAALLFAIAALVAFAWFGGSPSVLDVLGLIALGLLALVLSMFP